MRTQFGTNYNCGGSGCSARKPTMPSSSSSIYSQPIRPTAIESSSRSQTAEEVQFQFILLSTNKIISPKAAVACEAVRARNPNLKKKALIFNYCRFHLVCPGQKIGERNFFWAWYKLKLICMLYFHFVPSPGKVSLAKFFHWRGGGQTKWNRQYIIHAPRRLPEKSFLILDLECVKLCSK